MSRYQPTFDEVNEEALRSQRRAGSIAVNVTNGRITMNDNSMVQVAPEQTMADQLIALAIDKNLDIEKLERLMTLKAAEEQKTAKSLFDAAMSRVQAKIQPIIANAENEQTGSRYAKLESIVKALSPIYTAEGFSVGFGTSECASQRLIDAGWFRVTAALSHTGGYEKTYTVDLPADTTGAKGNVNKTLLHGTKSTITYARVILMGLMFNFTTSMDVDDDGNSGGVNIIDKETAANLRDELAAVDADEGKFCTWLKITSLEDMPASKLATAQKAIAAKKRVAK